MDREAIALKGTLRVDSRMTRVLWAAAIAIVAISFACRVAFHLSGEGPFLEHLIPLFDVDMEQNLPTVFGMLLLAFAAQLFGLVASAEGRSGRSAWQWWALSAVLLMMAVDEVASLHEKLIEPVRSLMGEGAPGVFHYAWVIPGAAFVLLAAPFLIRFVLRLPRKARGLMFAAGGLYVGGALGFEFIGGAYADVQGTMNLTYGMITLVEESLEMAGVILLIQGAFAYLASEHRSVPLGFGLEGTSPEMPPAHASARAALVVLPAASVTEFAEDPLPLEPSV